MNDISSDIEDAVIKRDFDKLETYHLYLPQIPTIRYYSLLYGVREKCPEEFYKSAKCDSNQLLLCKYVLYKFRCIDANEDDFCVNACELDSIHTLMFFHQLVGFPLTDECMLSAMINSYNCMVYLHEQGYSFDNYVEIACKQGNLTKLIYMREHNCKLTYSALISCVDEPVKTQLTSDLRQQLTERQFICFKYLIDHSCPLDSKVIDIIVKYVDKLPFLKYIVEHGCPMNFSNCFTAIKHNNLSALQHLINSGCPVNKKGLEIALTETEHNQELSDYIEQIIIH